MCPQNKESILSGPIVYKKLEQNVETIHKYNMKTFIFGSFKSVYKGYMLPLITFGEKRSRCFTTKKGGSNWAD